jgi:heme-degrading monooxygenase HmoA
MRARRWSTRWLLLALIVLPLVPAPSSPDEPKEPRRRPTPGIARVWHGRTPNARADEYGKYLGDAIKKFRTIPGNLGYQMMRETVGVETHFMVISYWTSRDAIHAYAGVDIRKTRHLPRDAEFLIEPEQTVMNYDLLVQDVGGAGGPGSTR